MEQCGRRLCRRTDSVPKQNNENAEDVFKFVKGLIEAVPDLEIPEVVIDKAHRIGPDHTDKKTQKMFKSIIVRFTTFRHRTTFYRARRFIGNRAQVDDMIYQRQEMNISSQLAILQSFAMQISTAE